MSDILLQAAGAAFQISTILAVLAGVAIGIVIGAIPGLNAAMAIAVAVPLTFTMSPLAAIGMLVGVMKGGGFGGAVGAALLNTPGEPSAAATALDAYPLAKVQGKPRKALTMALYSSVAGDTWSDIVLITFAFPLAKVAGQMGKVEQTALILFSFTMIAGLSGRSLIRGLIATLLGVLFALVGRIEVGFAERFTFGLLELSDGLPIAAVAIGVLALPEVLIQIVRGRGGGSEGVPTGDNEPRGSKALTFAEYWSARWAIVRGAMIGTLIGALPGLGSSVAAFLSYGVSKRMSRHPEKFGKGSLEGIAASESANSAVNGANLIPLLTLGIPGNVTAALLIGAFIIHGVDPGPAVFTKDAPLIFGLFIAMFIANAGVLLIGNFSLGAFALILRTPGQVIYPLVALLCITGVYISAGMGLMGVWIMLVFGVLGYLMRRFDYSVVNFVIGFVLGDAFEQNLRGSITILHRDPWHGILNHPFAIAMVALTAAVVLAIMVRSIRSRS